MSYVKDHCDCITAVSTAVLSVVDYRLQASLPSHVCVVCSQYWPWLLLQCGKAELGSGSLHYCGHWLGTGAC